jgi:hypothetical protein
MTIEKLHVDVPDAADSIESVVCAECEHEPHASTNGRSMLRYIFGLAQRPQRCAVLEHDSSGWGAHPASATIPFIPSGGEFPEPALGSSGQHVVMSDPVCAVTGLRYWAGV